MIIPLFIQNEVDAGDLAANRMSAYNFCNPFDTVLPLANGEIGQADRQHLMGAYAGILALGAAPVFTGVIPDLSYDTDSGNQITDYSSYFTNATSYSIAPAVEAGWNFDTITGILTVDTSIVGSFSYVITGTNVSGSAASNSFGVTITAAVVGGVKARKIKYLDSDPLWKQKEKETDWVDVEIKKERKKLTLHKPVIIDVKETIDEQIREIYAAQAVKARIKKKRKNKAMSLILMNM